MSWGVFLSIAQYRSKFKGIIPDIVYDALREDPELSNRTDNEIIEKAKPDAIDWEIRHRVVRLLRELEKSDRLDKSLNLQDFTKGITTPAIFKHRISHQYKRHFITRRFHKFEDATDNMLLALTARLYEVATIPLTEGEGENKQINHKNARLMMDLTKLLLDRKHGQAVQRMVLAAKLQTDKPLPAMKTPIQIEAEIKALEAEFKDGHKGEVSKLPDGEEEVTTPTAVPSERGPERVQSS